jgi:hypothetical protein
LQAAGLSTHAAGHLLENAAVVRSQPRKNMAGSFLAALKDDWKPKKATPKPEKETGPATQPEEPRASQEEATAVAAQLRDFRAQFRASL